MADKLAPVPGGAGQKGKDAGAAPKIGYFPWDEDIATTYLWKNVLEKRGYKPVDQAVRPSARCSPG